MSERELLIREIAQTPDTLVTELLNFLLFIKSRKIQNDFQNPNSENSDLPSFLNFIDLINSETPAEENAQLPIDLSKNLDSYLYGSPKEE
ncbi:MAG: hypothetical protein P2A85_24910 [Microcoleus anatoxicus]|uniref:hypothetical protein n=1 Tax=Microcoleus anatoxicus TaxID=2705319 RepID=UPI00297A3D84|nr:MAG: hypothetical protein EAZ78_02560 [Oscillatoriales cyanobacterium]TAF63432.1 MAG: hypothetical protein EAZ59_20915 [Oscillatoriales cyanobacterium]